MTADRCHQFGYEIRIWYSAEKGDECFIAQVVEWPGIMAHGDTREELLRATPKQRADWRLIGRGVGIHWDDVDEDISVRTLLAS